MDKHQLRQWIREEKKRHTDHERAAFSVSVWKRLERHPRFLTARTLLFYSALPDEVQTRDFINRWCGKKQFILPVVDGEKLNLRLFCGEENLRTGAYGIREPQGNTLTDFSAIDLAVIPGMAFDRTGNRLGRGKGYYDRLLPHLRRNGTYIIGVCFDFQIVETVPCEPHDLSLIHI